MYMSDVDTTADNEIQTLNLKKIRIMVRSNKVQDILMDSYQ